MSRRSRYDTIKKFEEFGVVGNRLRTDRSAKLSKQHLTRLKRLTGHRIGISLRQIVPKFDLNISTISRSLKAMGIMYRRKKRTPKYTDKQRNKIPTRARRLCRTLLSGTVELIMDDEKYFMLHNELISADRGFYMSDRIASPPEVKFKRTKEFELKILVRIDISGTGVSISFFSYQQ